MYQIITMLSIDQDWLLTANLLLSVLLLLWVLRYRILYRNTKEKAEQYSNSLDDLNEGFYRADINGKLVYANRAMTDLIGYDNFDELNTASHVSDGGGYVDLNRRKQFHETLKNNGFVRNFISEVRNTKTNELIWVSENAHLVTSENSKNPTHYEGLILNITDAVQRGKLEDRIEKLSDNLPGGLFQLHVNKNGNFTVPYASPGFHELTGIKKSDLGNPKIFLENIHADYRERCANTLSDSLETMRVWKVEFKIKRPTGNDCWVSILATPELLKDGDIILHGHINDISERKTAEGKIAYYAYYDVLTGLPNRTFFMHHLEKAVISSSRTGIYKALLFLDIDNFKTLNDNYGHAVGDLLLKKVANRLNSVTRLNDTASRFGGDEFVFLLDAIGNSEKMANENAENVAKKIMREFQKGFVLGEHKHQCTPSIGIHTFNGNNTDCDVLIRNADTAMYEAKKSGKNKIVIFNDELSSLSTEPLPFPVEMENEAMPNELTA